MKKFQFDITTGLQRFVAVAQREGLFARKVEDAGPGGWPVVEIEGETDEVFKFITVYYDPEITETDLLEIHQVK
jgi:hypothetical protein